MRRLGLSENRRGLYSRGEVQGWESSVCAFAFKIHIVQGDCMNWRKAVHQSWVDRALFLTSVSRLCAACLARAAGGRRSLAGRRRRRSCLAPNSHPSFSSVDVGQTYRVLSVSDIAKGPPCGAGQPSEMGAACLPHRPLHGPCAWCWIWIWVGARGAGLLRLELY